MKDVIAEPYRTKLLPGFSEARQAAMEMAPRLAASPALAQRCSRCSDKPDTAQRVADWLGAHYLQNQEGFVHICRLDTAGARSGITKKLYNLKDHNEQVSFAQAVTQGLASIRACSSARSAGIQPD